MIEETAKPEDLGHRQKRVEKATKLETLEQRMEEATGFGLKKRRQSLTMRLIWILGVPKLIKRQVFSPVAFR